MSLAKSSRDELLNRVIKKIEEDYKKNPPKLNHKQKRLGTWEYRCLAKIAKTKWIGRMEV